MGNEAIARGLIEAGCSVATGYPGTPSSEIMESLAKWKKELGHRAYLEWSINEKVAFEVAYGASLAGARSAVTMKMVGLNVASDAYLSATYLGVRGGMVLIVADDPGPHSSQTEQDSRFFAWLAKAPAFDPSTPVEALEMIKRAYEISERYEIPVMLRPCLRVCHSRQNVTLSEPNQIADLGPFKKNWPRWAAIPKFRLALHGELNKKLQKMSIEEADCSPHLIHEGKSNKLAIITSGSVASHVLDTVREEDQFRDLKIFKLSMPFPANRAALQAIVDGHERTLVIEETYPVIELQVDDKRKLAGRLSGLVPSQGELTPEVVEDLILQAMGEPIRVRPEVQINARRPSLCAGCPHRPSFFMLRKVFDKGIYPGDIGCYTLGINMGAVDTCLCMGASIGMASGLTHAPDGNESPAVVATIGDSTFFHAGIPALINAVHTKTSFTLILMDNSLTAMTGGQPTPASMNLVDGSAANPVDIENLIRACGVGFIEVVDPYDYDSLKGSFERSYDYSVKKSLGVSVIITRRPCIRAKGIVLSTDRYEVLENCERCMTCVRDLECPAISFVKESKKVVIDPDSCSGCGFCVNVCPCGAIVKKVL
ncbi:MAG: indolepyruvate ferredoxin oxidoreductase subunit alpha [Syntrophaceae bacterium]|nr:indolepyruvate ferredoxin oxidoreductase subunit alpha [Syntrophaceae bacterium]